MTESKDKHDISGSIRALLSHAFFSAEYGYAPSTIISFISF